MSETVTIGSAWKTSQGRHHVTVLDVRTFYQHDGPLVHFKITGGDTVTCTMKSFLEAHTPTTLDEGLCAAAEAEAAKLYRAAGMARQIREDSFVAGAVWASVVDNGLMTNRIDLEALADVIHAHEWHGPHGEGDDEHCKCECRVETRTAMPHRLHRAEAVDRWYRSQ